MKLRSEKNLDGAEGRNTEAGAANVTPTEPFEEGELTLFRPDHRHQEDPQEPETERELGTGKGRENPENPGEFSGRCMRGTVVKGDIQIGDQEQ